MSDEQGNSTPTDASAPFNNSKANVILRSSDWVDFRIREGILAEASSVFEDMFSLPLHMESGERKEQGGQEYRDGLPVITVSETSAILRQLLLYCYPGPNPCIMGTDTYCLVLEAARKYLMDEVEDVITQRLHFLADLSPVEMYCQAAIRKWKSEMKVAARASLLHPLPMGTYVPAMEKISAGDFLRLQVYHQACRDIADRIITERIHEDVDCVLCVTLVDASGVWFSCASHTTRTSTYPALYIQHQEEASFYAVDWFVDFLWAVRAAVASRPRGDTILNGGLVSEFTMRSAQHCPTCAPRARTELSDFVDDLAAEVENRVGRVRLEIKD